MEAMKTVFALHTGFALVEPLKPIFQELLPGVRIVTLVDDSLLADVRTAGGLTPSVIRRILGYGTLAESAGADAIFSCCSSVGEATSMLQRAVSIPVVKIDQAMAEAAVAIGGRIAVVATLPTTLEPTERLILDCADRAGRTVSTIRHLAAGAFDALMSGDPALHDELLEAEIRLASQSAGAIVLAQGSMARLVPKLAESIRVPLLSSPRSGVDRLRAVLEGRA